MTALDEELHLTGQASRRELVLAEAAALDKWSREIASRYPESVWPDGAEAPTPGSREAVATQRAFILGVRFVCERMRIAADEVRASAESEEV